MKVQRLNDDATLPGYGYAGDAGMDLAVVGRHVLAPGESRDLPTGIAVEMPPGFWGRITGRSSTLRKRGLFINEGVIDNGYRGELLVYVTNRQSTPVEIEPGDRLAQLILHQIVHTDPEWVDELSPSERGTAGFGSTGTGRVGGILHGAIRAARSMDIDQMQQDGAQEPGISTGYSREYVGLTDDPAVRQRMFGGPVYLGGAVDVGNPTMNHMWRHEEWRGVLTYCPICECRDLTSPLDIIIRNTKALDEASDAVFVLDAFSVGTPIEAHHRIVRRSQRAVIVYPHKKRSVFVDWMSTYPGVEVVSALGAARRLIAERAQVEVPRDT